MFSRILVPTDFSEHSDMALEHARVLATKFGSTLHLLHVLELSHVNMSFGTEVFTSEAPDLETKIYEDAKANLASRATPADRARFNVTTEIVKGMTAKTITEAAEARHMDLIVMGTHGRGGVAHLLMGSVAETVVRTAPCPVLTVRDARERVEVPAVARTAFAM